MVTRHVVSRDAPHARVQNRELTLRDRKKEIQRAELLRIALALFRRRGFTKTRMQDIAAQAQVSVPTVYNYFPSKQDLLVAYLIESRLVWTSQYEMVLRNPPRDPAYALAELIYVNFKFVDSQEEKQLQRELLSALILWSDRDDKFDEGREIFKDYIRRLIELLQDAGKLSDALPIAVAVDLIYSLTLSNFRLLIASDKCSPYQIRQLARKQMKCLLADWRRKDGLSRSDARRKREPNSSASVAIHLRRP